MANLSIPYHTLYIKKGTDFTTTFLITDSNRAPRDLSKGTVYGYLRKSPISSERIDFVIDDDNLEDGLIKIKLSNEATNQLDMYNYLFDVFYQDENNIIDGLVYGTVKVYP